MRVPKKFLEEGNILDFYQDEKNISRENIILPTEQYDAKRSKREINEYIARVVKEPELQAKTVQRFEDIFTKVLEVGGTVRPLWSLGGSKEGVVNKDLLDYVEIRLNGTAILEPVGQVNNAMFVLKDDENLLKNYQKTRRQLTQNPEVYKISHEANPQYNSYNFDGIGILEVIDAISKNKEAFMSAATPQNLYSNLTRVMNNFSRMIREEDEGR
ncbi:MAG: hypothetical protein IJ867_06950 [Clostridia bacterium]|nr:hypothetical protein [Clostridia bacterium]